MMAGTVSKLVDSYGSTWGLITPDGETRQIYFNPEGMQRQPEYPSLVLGQRVSYDEEPDRANGTHAVRVRPRI